MPYPGQFHRLVLFGTIFSDTWNTSLSIVPSALGEFGMPQVNQATIDAVATVVSNWFSTALSSNNGAGVTASSKLVGIKLNRITPAGLYADPEFPMTKNYASPIAGAGVSSSILAPQLTIVSTLRTAIPRGQGSRGRMYMPPQSPLGALDPVDGRITAALATSVATSTAKLASLINSQYIAIGKVGVASNTGSGRFEHVTRITVGRVPDTMRTRRNKQREEPLGAPVL